MPYNFNWSVVSGGAPYVTISSIAIAFNRVSIEKLGNPEKVIVGFDEEQRVIGIKPYNGEPNTRSYNFARRVKNGWIRIGCKDFIKYLQALIGIEFLPSKKFLAKYDDKNNILLVFVAEEPVGEKGE